MEIRLSRVQFRYPDGGYELSLDELIVSSGQRVAITGPSGFGKTTLLRLISGILTPDQGTTEADGRVLSGRKDSERRDFRISRVGFVFQELELLEYLDARENALLPFRINAALRLSSQVEKRADDLLDRLGLGGMADRKPSQLSQGERQRVAVARALIAKPSLLLADEPSGNLDEENKRILVELILSEAATLGATALVVTHDTACLDSFDRVIRMDELATVKRGAR